MTLFESLVKQSKRITFTHSTVNHECARIKYQYLYELYFKECNLLIPMAILVSPGNDNIDIILQSKFYTSCN